MQGAQSGGTKQSNGHTGSHYDDVVSNDMDLDEHPSSNGTSWDKMDTEDSRGNSVAYGQLLADTISYGKTLQAEFSNDPRREIGKALGDAFALLAYQDPLNEKEVSHRLDVSGRVAVAEELNAAILRKFISSSNHLPLTYVVQYPLANPLRQLSSK